MWPIISLFVRYWNSIFFVDFCYGVYNQCELFIYLDLMVKNSEITIERYFKW
jgi:hypothetical protein